MQPDWDMFHVNKQTNKNLCFPLSLLVKFSCLLTWLMPFLQSLHPMAEYHGAARAVGGCAIYVR